MTEQPPPALTRDLGEAERSVRAVLQTRLNRTGLSFPEWTTLVTLDVGGPLTRTEVIERQVAGQVASAVDAEAAIDRLVADGLLADELELRLTGAGEATYRPIRQDVNRLTQTIFGDLPAGDLEATQRTLQVIASRARQVLAGTG